MWVHFTACSKPSGLHRRTVSLNTSSTPGHPKNMLNIHWKHFLPHPRVQPYESWGPLVLQHIIGGNSTFQSPCSGSKLQLELFKAAIETLEVRHNTGSRGGGKRGMGEEGGVGSSVWLPNKQRLDESRGTHKKTDNELVCAVAVKWSGKLSGLVGRSPQEGWRGRNWETFPFHFPPPKKETIFSNDLLTLFKFREKMQKWRM